MQMVAGSSQISRFSNLMSSLIWLPYPPFLIITSYSPQPLYKANLPNPIATTANYLLLSKEARKFQRQIKKMSSTFAGSDDFETVDLIGCRNNNRRTVTKLVHLKTGNMFAVKSVYTSDKDNNAALASQFSSETELLLSFDHPNVVKCHDVVFNLDECEYKLLLEFMDGGSLVGKQITDVGELAGVSRHILQGLAYLHGKGVPHWDIKPSNILMSGDVAKIADFGSSRYLRTIKDESEFMETVSYLSPERIDVELKKAAVSEGSLAGDIWGFGMSVLEAYLGKYPIEGVPPVKEGECIKLMKAICEVEPPRAPLSAPPEFSTFIACCLRKEPASRWTAEELLQHPFILRDGAPAAARRLLA
ncbi:Mitogen-activated protein kinase kinase 5 [Linum grandiflorum]